MITKGQSLLEESLDRLEFEWRDKQKDTRFWLAVLCQDQIM